MVEIVAEPTSLGIRRHHGRMQNVTVYGIPNCDTVKKARAWLDAQGVRYTFHDFKKQGVPPDRFDAWIRDVGWETLLNRKGTSWRKLDEGTRERMVDAASARELVQQQPSMIKRPVVEWGAVTTVGFDVARWERMARERV
jgi:arsenate reductase (glutaredoxin)